MTDITELAQSLKAAAEKAQIEEGLTWFSEDQLSHEDGIALHKADAEFIAMANPANILALVEALDKAQQRIDELENDEVRQRLANAEHQLYMAELAKNNLRASRKAQFRKRKAAEQRIAELESRTVTVKLPQRLQPGADGWDDWYVHSDDEGEYLKFDDVLAMLTAAGIKVEAE
ncbi:ead/Ea22-like family protein [Klebsiella pneumoniae]|uniref:ead/Ea22-like family protein n=1 Tax=Klebsiella pneumoniae TaxID=573 RepID=UPI000E2C264A|nr:ead/Ea22-like family protein [Klebsiella pneumoniae]MDP1195910.1 ead/Ea22-like family protein [Klebsiella pneumoniae]SWR16485.1 Ead domain protein [Klebsiella pneumoniae]SWR17862.1 Ead domain protein [Klebsiella pneumoniae]HCT7873965.1 ead/Ea22-like family protein [Klebsiella pneumoniae]